MKEAKLRLVSQLQIEEEEGKEGGKEKEKGEEEKEVLIPDWFWQRVQQGKVSARKSEGGREGGKNGGHAP